MTIFDVEELWTHGGSLRIYARPAADTSRPVSARVLGATPARGDRRLPRPRDLRALRGAGPRDEAQDPRAAHRAQARRQDDRRLRRPGQGQHAAQLLRHPHRLHRLHGRPQPVQAGPVPARHAHPDLRPRADRRGQARLHLHPPVERQGRDPRAARPTPATGGRGSSCRSRSRSSSSGVLQSADRARVQGSLAHRADAEVGDLGRRGQSAARRRPWPPRPMAAAGRWAGSPCPRPRGWRPASGWRSDRGRRCSTRTPASLTSSRRLSASARSACLVDAYGPTAPTRREPGARVYEYDLTSAAAEGRQQGLRQQVRGPDVGAILRV